PVLAGPEGSVDIAKLNVRFNAALKLADRTEEPQRKKAKAEMEALAGEGLSGAALWLGVHYYYRRRPAQPEKALVWFLRGAELGNHCAQYQAAELLRTSPAPVRRDIVRAQKLYEKSAEREYGPAQTALGLMFLRGDGVKRDDKKAFRWFARGAANKDAEGQLQLAKLYEIGRGTRKDLSQAAKWYKAAGEKNIEAAFRFAEMCDQGLGVAADKDQAVKWYRAVASRARSNDAYRIRALRRLKELGS
ncbi:MAG: tetratricopeptide repeat protein, partial [Planctomycetota bacterium]